MAATEIHCLSPSKKDTCPSAAASIVAQPPAVVALRSIAPFSPSLQGLALPQQTPAND